MKKLFLASNIFALIAWYFSFGFGGLLVVAEFFDSGNINLIGILVSATGLLAPFYYFRHYKKKNPEATWKEYLSRAKIYTFCIVLILLVLIVTNFFTIY